MADISFVSGVVSGSAVSVLVNPIDHALYLSTVNNRSFFNKNNFGFSKLFKGLSQSIGYRVYSNSIYFSLQNNVKSNISTIIPKDTLMNPIVSGLILGTINGILCHPLSSVKLTMWGLHEIDHKKHNFFSTFIRMYKHDFHHSFFKGMSVTIARDGLFGIVYETGKYYGDNNFYFNMLAGTTASIIVSPVNYVKIMKFSPQYEKSNHQFSTSGILKDLFHNIKSNQKPFNTLCTKLNIGPGSFNVGFKMAVGQFVFDHTFNYLNKIKSS